MFFKRRLSGKIAQECGWHAFMDGDYKARIVTYPLPAALKRVASCGTFTTTKGKIKYR
jgi:hypothetical protein